MHSEREQIPQVADNKHFRIELIEHLEPVKVLSNQRVSGSILAGGSGRDQQELKPMKQDKRAIIRAVADAQKIVDLPLWVSPGLRRKKRSSLRSYR